MDIAWQWVPIISLALGFKISDTPVNPDGVGCETDRGVDRSLPGLPEETDCTQGERVTGDEVSLFLSASCTLKVKIQM